MKKTFFLISIAWDILFGLLALGLWFFVAPDDWIENAFVFFIVSLIVTAVLVLIVALPRLLKIYAEDRKEKAQAKESAMKKLQSSQDATKPENSKEPQPIKSKTVSSVPPPITPIYETTDPKEEMNSKLTPCPDCNAQVSRMAASCPQCGCSFEKAVAIQMTEKILYQSHPSMFRNNPIGFILSIILIFIGIGLLILLIWWLRVLGTTLIITDERVTLRKGILSKHTNDVYHSDIRNVQVRQGLTQRLFGVGNIGISSAGQSGIEIDVAGIPHPEKIKSIIDEQRRLNK